jgi:hypothetical protein
MDGNVDPRLTEAFEELDGYLADRLPPLLVTDSFELFLESDPALLGGALYDWAISQFRVRGGGEPLSDLLFHGLKKIQLLEEFHLVPPDKFVEYLRGVAGTLLQGCPPEDAERLAGMLHFLREARGSAVNTVGTLYRAPTSAGTPTAADAAKTAAMPAMPSGLHAVIASAPAASPNTSQAISGEELRSLRRFTALLERLGPVAGGAAPAEAQQQLLITAATAASNASELESRMSRLHELGFAPAVARDLVQAVAKTVPDWVIHDGPKLELAKSSSLEAVRRVVKLAGDGAKVAERWKDLLRSAVEQFNQGSWARAVTLIEVAEGMIKDGSISTQVAELSRGHLHESFDMAQVLQCGADPKNRPILRRLVEFFPGWSARELLDQLVYQPDQKKRRLILLLLEVWGSEARPMVVERLATVVSQRTSDENVWWFLRNLVFLLHKLPRSADSDPRAELKLVAPFSTIGNHPSFQREVYVFLAMLPGGHGATTLVQRLADLERALASPTPPYDEAEMTRLLNALAAALARCGSLTARRALVEHALAPGPRAADSAARLRELSTFDLSGDREVLALLLGAIRTHEPVKVLGFSLRRNEETLTHVVRALAATSDSEVRRVLSGLAAKYPDRAFGRAAAGEVEPAAEVPAARDEEPELIEFEPAPPPVKTAATPKASLTGDLEVFGLPGLLQSLQQSEVSGRLTLRDAAGAERAVFEIAGGRLGSCRCGRLRGEAAFYQVFELPAPGTFELVRTPVAVPEGERLELMGLLLEAMRRYDELRRARALVPDEARLRAGDSKPTAPPEEADGELLQQVWAQVRAGATAAQCEQSVAVDSFRVRTLLAHWIDEGAVRIENAA